MAEHAYPGQTESRVWTRNPIHAASSYFCSWCGVRKKTPYSVYRHLDSCKKNKRRVEK